MSGKADGLWYLRGGLFVALGLIAASLAGSFAIDRTHNVRIAERERARIALDTILVTSAEQLAYLGGIRDAIGPYLAFDDRNALDRSIPDVERAIAILRDSVAEGHMAPRSLSLLNNRLIAPFRVLDHATDTARTVATDDESWGEAATFDVANARAAIMQALPLVRRIRAMEQTDYESLTEQLSWWRGAGMAMVMATLLLIGGGIFLPLERRIRSDRVLLLAERRAAEEASAVKSTFIATMSHEIRTPLVGILGSAELLQDKPAGPEAEDLRRIILASGRSLLTVLNDVLDISALDAGKMKIRAAPADVREILSDIRQLFAAQATNKGIALGIYVSKTIAPAYLTDAARLRQVLSNLVGNAVKFTHSGSVDLRLTASEVGPDRHALIFEVADTGDGIEADQLDRVFEAFAQVESGDSRRQDGTGLGLAISTGIANAIGGRLTARSTPGEGSAFCLQIELPTCAPTIAEPAAEYRETVEFAPRGQAGTRTGENRRRAAEVVRLRPRPARRVLVVDDNLTNRIIATKMLEAGDWTVHVASDGHQAVDQFRQHRPELILMDISMPGMDGYDATVRIRKFETEQGLARTRIVALSAHVDASHRERCIISGMDDVLRKPISRADMDNALTCFDRPAEKCEASS